MHKRSLFALFKGIFLVQVFIIALIAGVNIDFNQRIIQNASFQNILFPLSLIEINEKIGESLIRQASATLAMKDNGIYSAAYIRDNLTENLIVSTIQALAFGETGQTSPKEKKNNVQEIDLPVLSNEPDNEVNTKADHLTVFKDCQVILYCTHNAESYIPDSGQARLDGQRGLINNVAGHINNELKNKGLDSVFIDTIHDYPEYQTSYTNSRKTVQEALKSRKKVIALFDIHRDSIPGTSSATTVNIGGKKSAPILIIVGTDERKPHTQWRSNLDFAERLFLKGEKMYPGLIKEVRTKAGTYNQEFHPRSLLIEVGTDNNSLAQAQYAGELFSDIVLEVLKEEI